MSFSPVIEQHLVTVVRFYAAVEVYFNPHFLEVLKGCLRSLVRHAVQQAGRGFHQVYIHGAQLELGIVFWKYVVLQLAQRAGQLYTGRAAAPTITKSMRLFISSGSLVSKAVSQLRMIALRNFIESTMVFIGIGILFCVLHAIEIGCRTVGYNKVVVFDAADRGFDTIFGGRDSGNFGQAKVKVFLGAEAFTEGKYDGAGFETRSGYLVEKWLKTVMVIFIEENRLNLSAFEAFATSSPPKPPPMIMMRGLPRSAIRVCVVINLDMGSFRRGVV